MFDKTKDLKPRNTKHQEDEAEEMPYYPPAETRQQQSTSEEKLYLMTFRINEFDGSLVIKSSNIPDAIHKFLTRFADTADEWQTAVITVERTEVL